MEDVVAVESHGMTSPSFAQALVVPKIQVFKPKQPLNLDDLDDLTPTYIGCATINR